MTSCAKMAQYDLAHRAKTIEVTLARILQRIVVQFSHLSANRPAHWASHLPHLGTHVAAHVPRHLVATHAAHTTHLPTHAHLCAHRAAHLVGVLADVAQVL